jgi:hypothetical protein
VFVRIGFSCWGVVVNERLNKMIGLNLLNGRVREEGRSYNVNDDKVITYKVLIKTKGVISYSRMTSMTS